MAHPVARYFGKLSTAYGEGEFYHARRMAVIEAIAPTLKQGVRMLDLGCGNGAFTLEFCLNSAFAAIFAADVSAEMIEAARKRVAEDHRVNVLRADASALLFRASAFDLVFMSNVLPFAADSDRCLEDAIRCIVPGGTLAVANSIGGVEAAMTKALGAERWHEFNDVVFKPIVFGWSRTISTRRGGQGEYQNACQGMGLTTEFRMIPYSCSWSGLQELIELRWLTLANENQRSTARRLLAEASNTATASMRFEFQESLLTGRKGR